MESYGIASTAGNSIDERIYMVFAKFRDEVRKDQFSATTKFLEAIKWLIHDRVKINVVLFPFPVVVYEIFGVDTPRSAALFLNADIVRHIVGDRVYTSKNRFDTVL